MDEVVSFGLRLCVSALPAAVFDAFPVSGDRRVFEAALAAFGPVFLVAIVPASLVDIASLNRYEARRVGFLSFSGLCGRCS